MKLTRKLGDTDYEVEAELQPSGAALFYFRPPLPGRPSAIRIDGDTVAEVLMLTAPVMKYSETARVFMLQLNYVLPDDVVPNSTDPDFQTCSEFIGEEVALEVILNELMSPCPNCGGFHFGEGDEDAEATEASPKKTYLN
jgi:hypothetical protein